MKVLIPIVIGLMVVGCGKKEQSKETAGNAKNTSEKPVKVLTAEEKKVFGEFEYKNRDGYILRYVLLENGVLEIQVGRDTLNMAVHEDSSDKWKMANGEIHIIDNYNRYIEVFRVNKDKSITDIGYISAGERTDYPQNKQRVFKRVKDTKSTSETKEPPANVTDTLAANFAALSPGINEIKVEHDGQSRRLIVTTPKIFSRQNLYPILFCFHGAGGKADGPSKRWSPHADKRGLIVISAEAVQPQAKWNFTDKFHVEEHDDVGFILKVVEALVASQVADPKTIYATGHSSGGLFCYRLAKETNVFAALSPMSCGMVKGAHDPDQKTKFVPILQVIGDQDKSFNGSQNKVTMYSASKRIDVWRKFNQCGPNPVVLEKGKEIMVYTYASQAGIEVALCQVKGQGHFIRRDLRDISDSLALDFLLKHKKNK